MAGVTAGLLIYFVASIAGLETLFALWPPSLSMLRWAGVLYLLILAADAWRSGPLMDGAGPKAMAPATDAAVFFRGMLATLLNPKTAVFYISLLPGFIRPGRNSALAQIVALGLIHLGVAVSVHTALALTGDGIMRLAGPGVRQGGLVNRGAAIGLAAVAIWLAVEAA